MHNLNRKKIFFSIIPFFYLFLMLYRSDQGLIGDLGRQIKMGEVIFNCRCVPQVNLFSFSLTDFPTNNHSWLSEFTFFFIAKTFGINSLLLLKTFLVLTSFTLIYLIVIKRSTLFATIIFSLSCIIIFSGRFSTRPELFSYLFLSLFLFLFEIYRTNKRIIFVLFIPLIMILWVNMHIYFIIGIPLYCFFLIEQYFVQRKKINIQLFIIGAALLLATLINPLLLHGALYPITIFNNYGSVVEENFPPLAFLGSTYSIPYPLITQIIFFLCMCVAYICLICIYPKTRDILYKLSGLFGLVLGWNLARCMAIFSLLGLPFLAIGYSHLQRRLKDSIGESLSVNTLVVLGLLLFIGIQVKGLISYQGISFSYEALAQRGTDFFIKNDLHGSIFNSFTIGNYLIYRLYPQERIFVDARPEAYTPQFFKEYRHMLENEAYFEHQAIKYKINVIFFGFQDDPNQTSIFLRHMLASNKWAPVYWDGNSIILVRNNIDNNAVITRYHLVKDSIVLPN